MDLGYNIDLLSDVFSDVTEPFGGDRPIDPERAYPRPVMARESAGDLLCQARLGSIVSIMPIDASVCGSIEGCNGNWHCLTGKSSFGPHRTTIEFPD